MKKMIISFVLCLFGIMSIAAQDKNNSADAILGNYQGTQGGEPFKVKFTKKSDGTYKAQIYWLEEPKDKNGKVKLDTKNPDKSLRNTPSDRIVLIDGLKYNSDKKRWDSAKIYDPQRGIKANVTATFQKDGRLMLQGTILGIGETVYWTPCKE